MVALGIGKQVLDLGCGRNKVKGAIGVDRFPVEGVNVLIDLESYPYPFLSGSCDEIYARHVIEHLESVGRFLDELYRMAKPGGRIVIHTPHYSYTGSWRDPTHRWHFSAYSFEYFAIGHPADYYTGSAKFRIITIRITMLKLWRILGVQWLINAINLHPRWRIFRRVWEEYLAFIFRAREIQATLEAVKDESK